MKRENEAESARVLYHTNRLARGYGNTGGSISVGDIVPSSAVSLVLTTYEVELDWLIGVVPAVLTVPTVLVHGESRAPVLPRGVTARNLRLVKPRLPISYGVCHGKLFVVVLPNDTLRVAVSTANLIRMDYERKAQGIWSQDFPLKSPPPRNGVEATQSRTSVEFGFEDALADYVERTAGAESARLIKRFDFSSANADLVTSVPGYHSGASLHRYGHMRMRKLLGATRIPQHHSDSPVVCQFSSVGSLTEKWMAEFHGSLAPREPLQQQSAAAAAAAASSNKQKSPSPALKSHVKLVWPTCEFVRESIDGWGSGGSLCSPDKNWKEFMMPMLNRFVPPGGCGRDRVPPHIKTYTRASDGIDTVPWVCLTSANMSQAAWGCLQKDGTQLMIRHYEIGVLITPRPANGLGEFLVAGDAPGAAPLSCCGGDGQVALLPFGLPLVPYGGGDVPWSWDTAHVDPDVFGNKWIPGGV